jgi:hypothetical protein
VQDTVVIYSDSELPGSGYGSNYSDSELRGSGYGSNL